MVANEIFELYRKACYQQSNAGLNLIPVLNGGFMLPDFSQVCLCINLIEDAYLRASEGSEPLLTDDEILNAYAIVLQLT